MILMAISQSSSELGFQSYLGGERARILPTDKRDSVETRLLPRWNHLSLRLLGSSKSVKILEASLPIFYYSSFIKQLCHHEFSSPFDTSCAILHEIRFRFQ